MRMLRRAGALIAFMASLSESAAAQLTIELTGVPANTPADGVIHVAGSFNNWNPAAAGFQLAKRGTHYVITLPASVRGPVEFKFTLGSWERVETTADGGDLENRTFTVPAGAATYRATIAGWRNGAAPPKQPTATASVSVIPSFEMPQLGRSRRLWIYLPPDYATSGRRYPVLYMHDGQNVFDAATSYAGEWGVDEALDSLHAAGKAGAIVVAVDHGQERRIDEYSPWPSRHGGGEGDAYVEFLVRTLKPWVDARYRTLPDRAHTGVAGSSMGGLISFYAALKHPDVFGQAGIFSPAFWIAPAAFDLAAQARPQAGTRFYIISGALEVAAGERSGVYQSDQQRMVEALTARGFKPGTQLVAKIAPDGRHTESFWRREFPAAFLWLFEATDSR